MDYQILLLLMAFVQSVFSEKLPQLRNVETRPPQPYSFGYKVHDKDGDQWRSEYSDGIGHVQGSYGFVDNVGMHREVQYVADEEGFRARIKTNEPGMDIPNPADVVMVAEPSSDYDAAIFGVENMPPAVRSNAVDDSMRSQKFYHYQKFAEPTSPPIYVVDGHLQSPWFPMDTIAVV